MMFTVIIPTRNRPALFRRALDSVLRQEGADFEIVVVDDGSDEGHAGAYRAIEQEVAGRARFLRLRRTQRGHGQSYALNRGAEEGRGKYVCFLDDDDEWIEDGYLRQVQAVITASTDPVDLHLADQAAYAGESRVSRTVWTEDLGPRLHGRRMPDQAGAYTVSVADLLESHGFTHLNTTTVRREFFLTLGGLDENIRYECDRDFYLRAIDRAELIKYSPMTVSRHNIPDPRQQSNMSTAISALERCLFQIRVLDKAILFACHPELRNHARQHKGFTLQRMTASLIGQGQRDLASLYAKEALAVRFSPRWLAYCSLLRARRLVRPGRSSWSGAK